MLRFHSPLRGAAVTTAAAVSFGLAGVCLASPSVAHAQQGSGVPGAPATASKVSLDLRDREMRSALEDLFKQTHTQYAIDPAVTGYINLSMKDQPRDEALRLLLRASSQSLTYTVENGVYLIRLGEPRTVSPLTRVPAAIPVATVTKDGDRISMDLREADVREALEKLFNSARAQYSIDPHVTGIVNLRITGQPFDEALRRTLQFTSPATTTYRVENGVYIVTPRPDAEGNTPEALKTYARAMQKRNAARPSENERDVSGPFQVEVNADKTVTITGTGPTRELLRQLMQAVSPKAGYFIAPNIGGDITTAQLRKLPVDKALKLTLEYASPRISYTVENGAYIFRAESDKNKSK